MDKYLIPLFSILLVNTPPRSNKKDEKRRKTHLSVETSKFPSEIKDAPADLETKEADHHYSNIENPEWKSPTNKNKNKEKNEKSNDNDQKIKSKNNHKPSPKVKKSPVNSKKNRGTSAGTKRK